MKRTELGGETLLANTEYQLAIPPDTQYVEFRASGFPVRVSYNQGEVAGSSLGGFVVTEDQVIGRTGKFDGPIYFASEQPHALLFVAALSAVPKVLAVVSGAFSGAFGSAFNIS